MSFTTDHHTVPTKTQRLETIAARRDSADGGYFVFYRGKYRKLPVTKLPVDILLYRADNGRLIMQLQEIRLNRGLPRDYFTTSEGLPEVQQLLHRLLLDLARDERGPIYQELAREAQQIEPILVTADGIIVNGNRRVAAMRNLLEDNPDRYASFKEVQAAVLPAEAQIEDIEYVEAALQLAPDTKLAYNWINRRLKIRRHRDELNLPVERIIESYRLENAQALQRELDELALAENYLENYCDEPGHYALVEDAEELFVGLTATLKTLNGYEQKLWQLAGFAMIYSRHELEHELKGYFPFAPPKPAYAANQALMMLAVEENLLTEKESKKTTELPKSTQKELISVLKKTEAAKQTAQTIIGILDQIKLEHIEKNIPKRLLKEMQQTRKLIETVDPEKLGTKLRGQLSSELAAILHHSHKILGDDIYTPSLIGGGAERAKGLNPDKPSFTAGVAHSLRAVLGPEICKKIGGTLKRNTTSGTQPPDSGKHTQAEKQKQTRVDD